MKCKYYKRCELYKEDSDTCNFCPEIDNSCGKFRELEEKESD